MDYDSFGKMLDYCIEHLNSSYYELSKYAMENNEEWHGFLQQEKLRKVVSYFLKDRKTNLRKQGHTFSTLYESLQIKE